MSNSSHAFVIEIDEAQIGLVSRRPDERFFTFISASSSFSALEGKRFVSPLAAELAARQFARNRRTGGRSLRRAA